MLLCRFMQQTAKRNEVWPMDVSLSFTVNGQSHTITTDAERPLLDVLREDLKLTGTKYGCGEGRCRACTVLMDDKPVLACVTPFSKADGKSIVTIEGFAENDKLHPVQEAFLAEGAFQCGYCTPGVIMQTVALLHNKPQPTRDDIVDGLNGNLCRCCGYPRLEAAVERAAAATSGGPKP
jgi:carbon-monoxide dehydrogenase small subunit